MRFAIILLAVSAAAQSFTQRGYLETGGFFFPQDAANDSGHAVGEALFRYEAFYKAAPGLRFAGAFDAALDTHLETSRDGSFSWWDRGARRPLFAVRRLSAIYSRGKLTVELGKQFVRWGKTDVLNPTDRFAPRDFLNVVDSDFLGITAARVTYGTQSDTVDVVFEPRLTPSRVPLLNQRWAVLPAGIPIAEQPAGFPGGPQFGARWNHIGSAAEYSFSFYNGYDNLPLYRGQLQLAPLGVDLTRFYPQMRMYGGDLAIPLRLVTVKAEAGYFTSSTPAADHYGLWVLQLERQVGEWNFAAGYAGQVDHGARHGCLVLPRPRRYPGRRGARRIHHRHQPCPGFRNRSPSERPGHVLQARIHRGLRTALARHRRVRPDPRIGCRFPGPIPRQLIHPASAPLQFLVRSARGEVAQASRPAMGRPEAYPTLPC